MERISDGNANYNILCEETQKDAVSERANLFSVTERSLSVNVIKFLNCYLGSFITLLLRIMMRLIPPFRSHTA